MSQHFRNILFPVVVGPSLIFYYLIFTFTVFSQQILGKKLLQVLKLCIKKKKKQNKTKKTIQENCAWNIQWILAHPIWLYILKKKFKNTTKY